VENIADLGAARCRKPRDNKCSASANVGGNNSCTNQVINTSH
jgi:hypothetical protein